MSEQASAVQTEISKTVNSEEKDSNIQINDIFGHTIILI